jgi:hypothetical protein
MGDEIYTKQAIKSKSGKTYAPGKDKTKGAYLIFVLCENYDGKVRGGIRKSWRLYKDSLTLDQAKAELSRLAGEKLY